ncbi:MAG: DUF4345 domain-containing protein [Hyphomonas sp.]|uniref:DUF4345 domain-containing protein n=1 Tax=Hyphomonas sp. TaxID=87 RepID=UPI003529B3E5
MKRGLQIALGIFSLIPLAFMAMGFLSGAERLSPGGVTIDLDNQYRYFSGMYLTMTLLIWYMIPSIEKHGRLMAIVCIGIFVGGLGRVISMMTMGMPSQTQLVAVGIEMVVPVVFFLWQKMVAAKA